jgi:hypothetical protein
MGKGILAILLAVALVLTAVGCGDSDKADAEKDGKAKVEDAKDAGGDAADDAKAAADKAAADAKKALEGTEDKD